jgi:hypothetical protein
MKQVSVILLLFAIFISCNTGPKKPDISNIKVDLDVRRFEKDFFGADTMNLDASLEKIEKSYPFFFNDYVEKIIGLDRSDSTTFKPGVLRFIKDYSPVFDSTKTIEKDIQDVASEIKEGLRYVRYYFPKYKLPTEFITFIGPMDAFVNSATGTHSEIITSNALCSGLQLHLGVNSSFYNSGPGQQLYPEYISRKFSTDYISVNCMKNIIDDVFPPNYNSKNFLDIMIDQGKRMYILDLLMPDKKDEIKLGYSSAQLKGAYDNEGFIWNYFTENNLLYESDFIKIRSFISDGPSTSEFGFGSPGFISLFMGRQIVRQYMENQTEATVSNLITADAAKVLAGSKYKPR